MSLRLSSETLHASTVALNGRAVLITGISGSGKSDLALQLIDRGFTLVSDDQTIVQKRGTRLHAAAPATIRGKLEIRGLGIVATPVVEDVAVALVVELASDIQRFPSDSRERMICGLAVPLISVDARTASAAAKVSLALDRFGLT
ncbi:HPr kinase/phosphatase C-terminal domain-containing protein [Sphingomonas kaistensis]|uniref:HPr kinase/phosphatase C-terminal domain-containing protein n=1 Tax=Sphingomonas kaistensis TaxID=298708 RepID=A0ABZ2G465_9SPHN